MPMSLLHCHTLYLESSRTFYCSKEFSMHATANEKAWVLVSEWVSDPAPYCPKMLGRMSTGKACCIGEWSRSTIRRLYQILFRKWSCSFAEKFINQRRLNYVLYQFFCLTVRGWNFSRTSRTCTADKAWGFRWWWSSEFWSFGKNYEFSPIL